MSKAKPKTPAAAPPSVRELLDRFTARVRHNIDVHLEALASDLFKAFEDPDGKADPKRAIAQLARAATKADLGEGRAEHLTRLLTAIRMLDEADTLRGILEGLGRGAAMEATRVAVLVVDGEMLRPFGDFGFAVGPRPSDVALATSPLLARAVEERIRMPLGSARSVDLPPFMRQSGGVSGFAIPVTVAGDVVALLYSEGPDRADGQGVPLWMEHVEVLSRHAAARLEAVTSRRTVEVFNAPGGQ